MTSPDPQRMPSLQLPGIEAYAEAHTSPEPAHLRAVAAETRRLSDNAQMMVGQLEGATLAFLVHMLRARHVLEVGTFTGYSSLAMAAALPPGGRITTLDIDSRHVEIARRHISASPYADRIEVLLGPALETLAALAGPFDFAFIDADKGGYRAYYEAILPKLAEGGVIAVDNVLWSGQVLGANPRDADTRALQALNDFVVGDARVTCVMLPVRDGLTLIRRR